MTIQITARDFYNKLSSIKTNTKTYKQDIEQEINELSIKEKISIIKCAHNNNIINGAQIKKNNIIIIKLLNSISDRVSKSKLKEILHDVFRGDYNQEESILERAFMENNKKIISVMLEIYNIKITTPMFHTICLTNDPELVNLILEYKSFKIPKYDKYLTYILDDIINDRIKLQIVKILLDNNILSVPTLSGLLNDACTEDYYKLFQLVYPYVLKNKDKDDDNDDDFVLCLKFIKRQALENLLSSKNTDKNLISKLPIEIFKLTKEFI
jgi:hypothetical protein